MKAELQDQLYQKHPRLYRRAVNPVYGAFGGFECGDGWFDLITDLSQKIEAILEKKYAEKAFEEDFAIEAVQVKEKYGTLRFYLSFTTDEIDDIIDQYEDLSAITCEECGSPGSLDTTLKWVLTLCDSCKRKRHSPNTQQTS